MVPSDLKYSRTHEYVKIEGSQAVVGITDYAVNSLGDIVYVELPEVGKVFPKGQEIGIVESVKSVSEIYSPLSGKIIEINKEAVKNPQIISQDPYGKGWLVRIQIEKLEEINSLLSPAAYEQEISK